MLAAFEIPILKHGFDNPCPHLRIVGIKKACLLPHNENVSDHFFRILFTGNGFFLFCAGQVFGFHKGKIEPRLHGLAQKQMGFDSCAQFVDGMAFFGDALL